MNHLPPKSFSSVFFQHFPHFKKVIELPNISYNLKPHSCFSPVHVFVLCCSNVSRRCIREVMWQYSNGKLLRRQMPYSNNHLLCLHFPCSGISGWGHISNPEPLFYWQIILKLKHMTFHSRKMIIFLVCPIDIYFIRHCSVK